MGKIACFEFMVMLDSFLGETPQSYRSVAVLVHTRLSLAYWNPLHPETSNPSSVRKIDGAKTEKENRVGDLDSPQPLN
jgi:hypothetical protein